MSAHSVEVQGMLPDPGCYEERYRLTGPALLGLGVSLVSVGLSLWWQSPGMTVAGVILAVPVISSAAGVILALPGVVAVAGRMTAFRADCAGITLGAVPDNLTFFRRRAEFVPWAEVEQIILSFAGLRGSAAAPIQRVSVRRREAAVVLPGVATCTARRITGWQLDAARLAAVTAVVAPGIPVIDAGTGSALEAETPSPGCLRREPQPAD